MLDEYRDWLARPQLRWRKVACWCWPERNRARSARWCGCSGTTTAACSSRSARRHGRSGAMRRSARRPSRPSASAVRPITLPIVVASEPVPVDGDLRRGPAREGFWVPPDATVRAAGAGWLLERSPDQARNGALAIVVPGRRACSQPSAARPRRRCRVPGRRARALRPKPWTRCLFRCSTCSTVTVHPESIATHQSDRV